MAIELVFETHSITVDNEEGRALAFLVDDASCQLFPVQLDIYQVLGGRNRRARRGEPARAWRRTSSG